MPEESRQVNEYNFCKHTVVDGHFDILMDVTAKRNQGIKRVIETYYLDNFHAGNVSTVVASIFVDDCYLPEMGLRKALNQISALYEEVQESGDKIALCRNYEDIVKAKADGLIGFVLSLEGVEPLYRDLGLLKIFYQLGVRIVGLSWSRRNYAGDGASYENMPNIKQGGLTDFGFQLVNEILRSGMIIDVSHLNDEGFWDVIRNVGTPVIASHSNCRSVLNINRNLNDKQICAIAEMDGVVGINASNILVSKNDTDSNIDNFINHIDHVVKLVGIRHVGLGFDFCNQFMQYVSEYTLTQLDRVPFDVFDGHKNIINLYKKLLERNYSENDIESIFNKNFMRVYRILK